MERGFGSDAGSPVLREKLFKAVAVIASGRLRHWVISNHGMHCKAWISRFLAADRYLTTQPIPVSEKA